MSPLEVSIAGTIITIGLDSTLKDIADPPPWPVLGRALSATAVSVFGHRADVDSRRPSAPERRLINLNSAIGTAKAQRTRRKTGI